MATTSGSVNPVPFLFVPHYRDRALKDFISLTLVAFFLAYTHHSTEHQDHMKFCKGYPGWRLPLHPHQPANRTHISPCQSWIVENTRIFLLYRTATHQSSVSRSILKSQLLNKDIARVLLHPEFWLKNSLPSQVGSSCNQLPSGSMPTTSEWACWKSCLISVLRYSSGIQSLGSIFSSRSIFSWNSLSNCSWSFIYWS